MKKLLITGAIVGGIALIAFWYSQQGEHQSEIISQPAPELGPRAHRLLPNLKKAVVIVPDRPHDPQEVFSENKSKTIQRTREFNVTTNSLGFRDEEVSPKTSLRIVCVGDSVTFGWGVADPDTYPNLLEQELGIDVINTGVPALKPEHIEAYIASFVETLEPNIVLVAMRPNWMTPNPLDSYTKTMRRIQYSLAKKNIHMGLILPPLASFDPKGRSNNGREVQHIRQSLNDLAFLDLTPIFDEGLPNGGVSLMIESGKQKVIDRVTGKILVEGTLPPPPRSLAPEIVDLFESDDSIKEPLFFDGGHPDKEGFVLFGKAVASWVTDQGWIENEP